MILVKVSLHPFFGAMMVYPSEPSFDIHNVYMHLRERFSIFRFTLLNTVFTHQRLVSIPFVGHNPCVFANELLEEWAEGRS